MSPVSVFDQRLEEDQSVNHLEDSIILWISIYTGENTTNPVFEQMWAEAETRHQSKLIPAVLR